MTHMRSNNRYAALTDYNPVTSSGLNPLAPIFIPRAPTAPPPPPPPPTQPYLNVGRALHNAYGAQVRIAAKQLRANIRQSELLAGLYSRFSALERELNSHFQRSDPPSFWAPPEPPRPLPIKQVVKRGMDPAELLEKIMRNKELFVPAEVPEPPPLPAGLSQPPPVLQPAPGIIEGIVDDSTDFDLETGKSRLSLAALGTTALARAGRYARVIRETDRSFLGQMLPGSSVVRTALTTAARPAATYVAQRALLGSPQSAAIVALVSAFDSNLGSTVSGIFRDQASRGFRFFGLGASVTPTSTTVSLPFGTSFTAPSRSTGSHPDRPVHLRPDGGVEIFGHEIKFW